MTMSMKIFTTAPVAFHGGFTRFEVVAAISRGEQLYSCSTVFSSLPISEAGQCCLLFDSK